ncbi:hypothetical protein L9F63_017430, partial [Diploptera punctata]
DISHLSGVCPDIYLINLTLKLPLVQLYAADLVLGCTGCADNFKHRLLECHFISDTIFRILFTR